MKKKCSIEQAIQVLETADPPILTVSDWAHVLGYSRSHFSRCFTREFSLNPKDYLKQYRMQMIREEVGRDPEAIGYKIAVNCGFIDEKALHKFLYLHYRTSLTEVKSRVA